MKKQIAGRKPVQTAIEQAAREIGEAVATFERYAELLPPSVYNSFVDTFTEWMNAGRWYREVDVLEPIILSLLEDRFKHASVEKEF